MARTIKIDLTGYDEEEGFKGGGGGFYIPEGIYPMKCDSAEHKRSKSNDNPMIEFQFTGTGGKAKGKKFYLYAVLDMRERVNRQKLGGIFRALGIDSEGKFEFDPDDVEDVECDGQVYTDTYNDEKRSKLRMVFASGGAPGEAEEEEEETTSRRHRNNKAAGNGKKKPVKLSEDEVNDMDESELEDVNDKHELEVDLSKLKTLSRKKKAVLEALTEKDLIA